MQPTNPEQFTEKAWEALVRTPEIAKQFQHQQIESEHLMPALLEQEGLASSIFNKAGVNVQKLHERTIDFINRQPKVSGASSGSVYIGHSLETLLDRAEQYRKEFGDEYISIEHLILA
ncbi:Clp protease N-terminal domain-containing protein, partial [Nostoc sp. UIC 10607]|uniref:Clp protease N-terminal domain-containing protein n=1 Tax=Nostoc sp. UIC 10607 TaxID=3045935 RepID=UPI0039A3D4CE